jgi:hypothetical protein
MNRALHFAVDNYGFARAAQLGGSQGAASYQLELSAHPTVCLGEARWSNNERAVTSASADITRQRRAR